MSRIIVEQILVAFDDAWSHQWESLAHALKDLTEAEARWQHPAYSKEEVIPREQLPGSILWHIVHIEQCERQYEYSIRNKHEVPTPTLAHEHSDDLAKMLVAMENTHQQLRDSIAALSDEDLNGFFMKNSGQLGVTSIGSFIHAIIRHNAWHGGQMMVARRLYRAQHQAT